MGSRSRVLCAFVACLATASVAPSAHAELGTVQAPIIDGRLATSGDILATVALVDPESIESFCTGTLIAPRVVVTAAHCVVEEDEDTGAILRYFGPDEILVVAGALSMDEAFEEQAYAVTAVTAHPDYPNETPSPHPSGAGVYDDIAVIVLETAVSGMTPAVVPTVEQAAAGLVDGASVTVSGYGLTDPEGDDGGVLYIAEVPFVYRGDAEIVLGVDGGPDTCQGDSGGPAYLRSGGALALVGTTSRGAEDVQANCGGGGIYTFTPYYRGWLASASGGAYQPGGGVVIDPGDPVDPVDPGDEDDDDEYYYDDDEGCAGGPGNAAPGWIVGLGALGLLAVRRRRLRA